MNVQVINKDGTQLEEYKVDPKDASSVEKVSKRLGELGESNTIEWLSDPENIAKFFKVAFISLFVIDGLLTVLDIADPELTIQMMREYGRVVVNGDQVEIFGFLQKWENKLQGPFKAFLAYLTYIGNLSASGYLEDVLKHIPSAERQRLYRLIEAEAERAQKELNDKKALAGTSR